MSIGDDPRQFQWRPHNYDLFAQVFDIAPHLDSGENCIAVHVESYSRPATLKADGAVLILLIRRAPTAVRE